MHPVRYIHAADLHLDAAFAGVSREAGPQSGHLTRIMSQATFTAMERLFVLCEVERPDFLVIAGDIYNQEDQSIRAQLRLRDACERLAGFGVRVFLAHGNHDPLPSRLHTLRWPANVTVFGNVVESHAVPREGETVAFAHGISHENAKEGRNLARSFRRRDSPCFQLGILHCSLEGGGAERYAPCSLEDLRASGLDAWALGHVHERAVLSEQNPFALYSGNVQGLHINESGERGCFLISAVPSDGGFSCTAAFKPLGPVIWQTRAISLNEVEHMDALDAILHGALEELAADAPPGCEAVLTRLRLTGRTPLDAELRRPAAMADVCERLRGVSTHPPVWLKDIDLQTNPMADVGAARDREDLLGETLRLAEAARASGETMRALADAAMKPLLEHARFRKALPPLSDEDHALLLNDAERMCFDLLENS
ncbi:MAG: DNA repair exonuclease [Deltaproteobacteria bacterium]|jgi:DNA repair exonuclease SbcCD nuclease subunit|nr:DNA repair exonuclease [Deltaproteobacteria bacterium]